LSKYGCQLGPPGGRCGNVEAPRFRMLVPTRRRFGTPAVL
jgi:hypothetical protein